MDTSPSPSPPPRPQLPTLTTSPTSPPIEPTPPTYPSPLQLTSTKPAPRPPHHPRQSPPQTQIKPSNLAPPPHPNSRRPTPLQNLDELFQSLPKPFQISSPNYQTPPAQILPCHFPQGTTTLTTTTTSTSTSTNNIPQTPTSLPQPPPKTPRAPSPRARRAAIPPSTPFRARPAPDFARIHQRLFDGSGNKKKQAGFVIQGKGRRMSSGMEEGGGNKRRCVGDGVTVEDEGGSGGRGDGRVWRRRVTTPVPFTFRTQRIHERWVRKEEERRKLEEKIEKERRKFKARPMPNFRRKVVVGRGSGGNVGGDGGLRTPRLVEVERKKVFTPMTPRKVEVSRVGGSGVVGKHVRLFENLAANGDVGTTTPVGAGRSGGDNDVEMVDDNIMTPKAMEVLTPMSVATPMTVEKNDLTRRGEISKVVLNGHSHNQDSAMFKTPKPVRMNGTAKKIFETSPIETPDGQGMKHVR